MSDEPTFTKRSSCSRATSCCYGRWSGLVRTS
jgi:hypothetical protein